MSVVFFLYFAQWIVVDRGVADIYFNLTFTISALMLLFTVPVTGVLLDKYMRRISGIRVTTILTVLLLGGCSIFAILNREFPALIFYTLRFYFYLLSFTFYTPLINDISKAERRGFISGLGIGTNYAGQFFGLLIALPFSNGSLSFFSSAPRAETLLPAVLIFFIFSLPMLIFFREPRKKPEKLMLSKRIKETFFETKILLSSSGVFFFLLAYFLFNDAILTSVNNFSIFLEQVWQVSDEIKTYLLLAIIVTSAVGGISSGIIADKFGHKRTLMFILLGWTILFPIIGLLTNFSFFVAFVIILGFLYGSNWTVSRSVMAYLAPNGKHNLAFAYFGLAERASSFLGPVIWGLIVSGLVSIGSSRYRVAMLSLAVFILLGLLALSKVKDDRTIPKETLDKKVKKF